MNNLIFNLTCRRLVAKELAERYGVLPIRAGWAVRQAEEASDEILCACSGKAPGSFANGLYRAAAVHAGFSDSNSIAAIGDGKIIEWLLDPANQEKLKAFIEFIIEIVAMLAPLFM